MPRPTSSSRTRRSRRCRIQNGGGFRHLHHEGGAPARQIVAGPDAGEDAVHHVEPGARGGHERAHLRQYYDQRSLPEISGFAAHIGAGKDDDLVRAAIQVEIVGNKAFVAAGQLGLFDHRVTALENLQVAAVVEQGAAVIARGGQRSQREEHVDLGHG